MKTEEKNTEKTQQSENKNIEKEEDNLFDEFDLDDIEVIESKVFA